MNDYNSGALFVNKKKLTDKHPDRVGNINVEGKNYRISGWINTSKDGKTKYMAIRVSPVEEEATTSPTPIDDDAVAF